MIDEAERIKRQIYALEEAESKALMKLRREKLALREKLRHERANKPRMQGPKAGRVIRIPDETWLYLRSKIEPNESIGDAVARLLRGRK